MKKVSRKQIFVAVFLTIPSAIITFGTASGWEAPHSILLGARKFEKPKTSEQTRYMPLSARYAILRSFAGFDKRLYILKITTKNPKPTQYWHHI
jgi:hypothetical protein